MLSAYRRRSRKQFRREGQSLAPNTDTAGLRVSVFRRFLPAQYPPGRVLDGRVVRRETTLPVSGPQPVAGLRVSVFRRFLPAQYPPGRVLDGRVVRQLPIYPFSTDAWRRIPKYLRRFLRAQFPPGRVLDGRTERREARPPPWVKYTQPLEGWYRVADTDLEQYELYRGIDAAPDFGAAPWETFT